MHSFLLKACVDEFMACPVAERTDRMFLYLLVYTMLCVNFGVHIARAKVDICVFEL